MDLESVWRLRPPSSNRFGAAFAQFLEVVFTGISSAAEQKEATGLINDLIAAGLITQGPVPSTFYAADVDWNEAFEIWEFYEVYRRSASRDKIVTNSSTFIH